MFLVCFHAATRVLVGTPPRGTPFRRAEWIGRSRLKALRHFAHAANEDERHVLLDRRAAHHELAEVGRAQTEKLGLFLAHGVRASRLLIEDGELAEEIAFAEGRELERAVADGDLSFHDHEEILARIAGGERLLVLGPNVLLAKHGARTTPLWSPDLRFLFDATLPPAEVARRLRRAGVGFVLLTQGEVNARFLARSAFFRDPAGTLQPAWSDPDLVLLRVNPPSP